MLPQGRTITAALARRGKAPPLKSCPSRLRSNNRCFRSQLRDSAAEGAQAATQSGDDASKIDEKSEDYSETMQKRMNTSLVYNHDLGINWDVILNDVIVGSCLQTPADVDRLAEEAGVTTVYCLQEDSDLAYFSVDVNAIAERCAERGDIKHVRFRIRDFDPFDLRLKLPKAVTRLAKEHNPSRGKVYIHCTAGMGRAPAVALAYMTWLRDMELDAAWDLLRSRRACSPRLPAIRAATADLLLGIEPIPVTISLQRRGTVQKAQVAGLDVGWHTQLDMAVDPATKRFVLNRSLLPGRYPFKFVLDGKWTASADYPVSQDGENSNNFVDVAPRLSDAVAEERQRRILSGSGPLTTEEREELRDMLCPWSSHDNAFSRVRITPPKVAAPRR